MAASNSITSNASTTSAAPALYAYAYDSARLPPLAAASPPRPYASSLEPPPPPPPSFARPHMPPSPQQHHLQHHHHHHHLQRPSYASSYGASRDLPGPSQTMRPGSSMSISSLIGAGDTGAPSQTTQSHPSPPTSTPPLNSHSNAMHPPSPRRSLLSAAPRPEFAPFRRPPSPNRNNMYAASKPSDSHNFPAGSPPRSYGNKGSPDLGRQSLPPSYTPYKLFGHPGSREEAAAGGEQRQPSVGVPPRPNSQPTGPPGSREQDGRPNYEVLGGRRSGGYGPPEERRRTLGESHHARPNAAELLAGALSGARGDRPVTVHPVSQHVFGPPSEHHGASGSAGTPPTLWRHSAPTDAFREANDGRREEPLPLHRAYNPYPSPTHGAPRYGGQSPDDVLRGRSVDHSSNRIAEPYHAPPTSDPTSTERYRVEPLSRSLSSSGRSPFDQPQRMGEAMQHSKSHIGFGLDASRRTGRASPLPQAVQGAQAQPMMSGKDPGIKSEFGRMFSGLGMGSSTPSRGSPLPQNGQGSFSHETEADMHRLQRGNPQQGRKTKRVKDEEGSFDADSNDGRGTPSSTRGAKRNKHHHHHAPHHHSHHHHHHHHHHHKLDEEAHLSGGSAQLNGRQSNTSQVGSVQPVHHHHHAQGTPPHHHHHHHHHHAPRGNPSMLPAAKIPVKVHDIQHILDEAAKKPRRHLGSHLYESWTELPKPNSPVDDQFGYASKPKRLPRFSVDPINCTFTIRVPRFYLKPRQRQHIVLERHLWGARVYRDDSDPIAAAIHAGWIRGEWDDTVDVSMLDPRITAPNEPADAEATLNRVPAAPVTPPADMDVQIEILLLPQLQQYTGSVEYGISSRKSMAHEGVSFMINKIRWVEDGIGSRGQERTAAALKRRLDASATLLALQSGADDKLRVPNRARLHV